MSTMYTCMYYVYNCKHIAISHYRRFVENMRKKCSTYEKMGVIVRTTITSLVNENEVFL